MTTPSPAPERTPQDTRARESEEKFDAAKAARLRHALTAGSEELFELLQDPDPDVQKGMLKNPHLGEQHLFSLLRRRDLPEQLLRSILRTPALAASRRLRIALAGHPKTPAAVLSPLLAQLLLFELVAVIELPGAGPDQKLAAERAIIKRLPETELGNRVTLARRGSPGILEALLKGGEPRLVAAVLANPKLREGGIVAFLAAPAATAETISMVARHQRWGRRPNLRFAMLRNAKTPRIWFTLFLPSLADSQLRDLLLSRQLTPEQLAEVRQELVKRELPP